jgi:hypothetical protein
VGVEGAEAAVAEASVASGVAVAAEASVASEVATAAVAADSCASRLFLGEADAGTGDGLVPEYLLLYLLFARCLAL